MKKEITAGILAATLSACATVGEGISKVGNTVTGMGTPATTTTAAPAKQPTIVDKTKTVYCNDKSVVGGAIDGGIAVAGSQVLGKIFGTDSTLGKIAGGAATGAGNKAIKNTVCTPKPAETPASAPATPEHH